MLRANETGARRVFHVSGTPRTTALAQHRIKTDRGERRSSGYTPHVAHLLYVHLWHAHGSSWLVRHIGRLVHPSDLASR
ncbi:hypothetical protein PUN4_1040002 [Paraburkholderia unamae]|nr:hypothetical protein PUN4_1040002 [Paraburkholderia unamae]